MEIKKLRRMHITLACLAVLLTVGVAALGVAGYELNNTNLFSKNIVLSNATFINTDAFQQSHEYPSIPVEQAASGEISPSYYASLFSVRNDLNEKRRELERVIRSLVTEAYRKILQVPHVM